MSTATRTTARANGLAATVEPVSELLSDPSVPLLYEDDGFEDMGETDIHTRTINTLLNGLAIHFKKRRKFRVFANLNLYYSAVDPRAYVSPDVMVVVPTRKLGDDVRSYRIGKDGPAPLWVGETLSRHTFEERDLTDKPLVYAQMKVPEYALIDALGEFLSVRLLLKQLQVNGAWKDIRDAEGGITSQLGFRLTLENHELRVSNVDTGERYLRPEEAADQLEAMAAELAKLRRQAKRKK
jgi:Uma2 family endonuclease